MSQILQRLRDVDPNDSDAVKEIINTFFHKENLSKRTDVNTVLLRVLETIITRFPRYCSQHRSAIEHYLSNILECASYYHVIDAAKCAHGLQQIRPSQDKMATAKNCWREQMNILSNAAHTLIESLFSNTMDIYKNNKNIKKKDISLLSNTPLTTALNNILKSKKTPSIGSDTHTILCNKLRNVLVFIQAMLVEVYPVAKPIQPQIVLEVIVQVLSLSSSVNTNVSEASTVKIEALRVLDALICCLGTNLVPYSALVFRFVMQTLRWSSDNPSEESRKVRIAAYSSLSRWLTTLHVHKISSDNKGRSWEDELTKHIIDDITPPKRVVQLTMSNQYTKNLSKKARRKLANTMLQQSTIANHMPGEKNKTNAPEEVDDDVANAALECAEIFLTVCGIFLKPTTHKLFQERLVRECYNLTSHGGGRGLRLLRALEAARRGAPPPVPAHTQHCLRLYSDLANSTCHEISRFCSQALLDIRLQLHCAPPTLNYAIDSTQQENKKKGDKRKNMSKKNREMLEILLGKERVPPETSGEVITIADEPANKKPRLDNAEDDKISLSSDSEASPEEISDDSDQDDADVEIVQDNIDIDEEQANDKEIVNTTNENNSKEEDNTTQINKTPDQLNELNETNQIVIDTCGTNNTHSTENSQSELTNEITQKSNIFNAKTQIPVLNASNDTIDGDKSPISIEITYDTNFDKQVPVLEKMDDENLPNTNETDDIQITCGQVVNNDSLDNSQKTNVEEVTEAPKVNGFSEFEEKILENGVANEDVTDNAISKESSEVEVKVITKEITVEDMLADFVDEVVEEGKTEA